MTNIDSPLNKSLYEPLGVRIVGTVIKAIVMVKSATVKFISYFTSFVYFRFYQGNRQEHVSIALEMLCDRKLPLIPEFVDAVIKQTPASPASVNHLVNLYERCKFVDSHKVSLHIFYICDTAN